MDAFYHAGPDTYERGGLITPTFGLGFEGYDLTQMQITCDHSDPGRIRYNTPSFGSALMLSRELAFEMIRLKLFQNKPSRLESVFACPTISALEGYLEKVGKPYYKTIYEVELQQKDATIHYGDFNACYWLPGMTFKDIQSVAFQYWSGVLPQNEVLTTSPLVVKRRVKAL